MKVVNSDNSSEPKESSIELYIVIGDPNFDVEVQESENFHIDMVKMFKEISDLRKRNEDNQLVIENLINTLDLLEKTINNIKSNVEEESSQNCEFCSFQTNE